MILGTVVKISTTITIDGAGTIDSVSISIEDESGAAKATDEAMIQDGTTTTYYYIYQTAETDDPGNYKVIIEAVSGSYTARSKDYFELETE